MTLRGTPGPDKAPRNDGLDLRWSGDYLTIVTAYPWLKPYVWALVGQAWDQGAREFVTKRNPFWVDDPDPLPEGVAVPDLNTKAPVEGKVYAATIGTGAGAVVSAFVLWLLGVLVWGAPSDSAHGSDAVLAVPGPVAAFVGLLITSGGAFLLGYLAKHTARPQPVVDEFVDAEPIEGV